MVNNRALQHSAEPCMPETSRLGLPTYHFGQPCRYALNWIKLRAWELTDWDALLWIDSDASVVGNVSSIFQLPTDFAAALDQGRTTNR